MMTNIDVTEFIRNRVSARDAGVALGLNVDRNGRCACPVHHGKDRNCRLSKGEKGFYCFVCHAGGDVIALVRAVQECDFPTALRWIDGTFRLGLPLDRKLTRDEQERIREAAEKRKKERQVREMLSAMRYELYLTASKLAADLQTQAETHRPLEPWDEWDEKFVESLKLESEAIQTAEEIFASIQEDGK